MACLVLCSIAKLLVVKSRQIWGCMHMDMSSADVVHAYDSTCAEMAAGAWVYQADNPLALRRSSKSPWS